MKFLETCFFFKLKNTLNCHFITVFKKFDGYLLQALFKLINIVSIISIKYIVFNNYISFKLSILIYLIIA